MNLYLLLASIFLLVFFGGPAPDGKKGPEVVKREVKKAQKIAAPRTSSLAEMSRHHSALARILAAIVFRSGDLEPRLLKTQVSSINLAMMKKMKADHGELEEVLGTLDALAEESPLKDHSALFDICQSLIETLRPSIGRAEEVREAVGIEGPPQIDVPTVPDFSDLMRNSAAVAADALQQLSESINIQYALMDRLVSSLSSFIRTAQPGFWKGVSEYTESLRRIREHRSVRMMSEAAKITEQFVSFIDGFRKIGKDLVELKSDLKVLSPLSKFAGREGRLLAIVDGLNQVGKELDSIVPGGSDNSFEELPADLSDPWIMKLVNGGSPLGNLSTDLKEIKLLDARLQVFRKESEPLLKSADWEETFLGLRRLLAQIQIFNQLSIRLVGVESLSNCLQRGSPSPPASLTAVQEFSDKLEKAFEVVSRVDTWLRKIRSEAGLEKNIGELEMFSNGLSVVANGKSSFDEWKKSDGFYEALIILNETKESFGKAVVTQEDIGHLEQFGSWWKEQSEVREWMKSTAIGDPTCDLELLDGVHLTGLIGFENGIWELKENRVLFKSAMSAIKSSIKAFGDVETFADTLQSSVPELLRGSFESCSSAVGDFAEGAHFLAQIVRIEKLRPNIETVISAEPPTATAKQLKQLRKVTKRLSVLLRIVGELSRSEDGTDWDVLRKFYTKLSKQEWPLTISARSWRAVKSVFKDADSNVISGFEDIGRAVLLNFTEVRSSFEKMIPAIDAIKECFDDLFAPSVEENDGFPLFFVLGITVSLLLGLGIVAVLWIRHPSTPGETVETPFFPRLRELFRTTVHRITGIVVPFFQRVAARRH